MDFAFFQREIRGRFADEHEQAARVARSISSLLQFFLGDAVSTLAFTRGVDSSRTSRSRGRHCHRAQFRRDFFPFIRVTDTPKPTEGAQRAAEGCDDIFARAYEREPSI